MPASSSISRPNDMTANEEQIEYWNGPVGERWARLQEAIDASLAPVTAA